MEFQLTEFCNVNVEYARNSKQDFMVELVKSGYYNCALLTFTYPYTGEVTKVLNIDCVAIKCNLLQNNEIDWAALRKEVVALGFLQD